MFARHLGSLGLVFPLLVAGCAATADSDEPAALHEGRGAPIKSNVPTGAFPEVVEIDLLKTAGGTGKCTGTLIRADAVLTARHCFKEPTTGVIVRPADLIERSMRSVALHPSLDLAVVRLQGSVAWAPAVVPIFPFAPAKISELVNIVGRTADGADVGVFLFAGHSNILAVEPTRYLTDVNTHHGDSGGPMFKSQGLLEENALPHFPRTIYGVLEGGIDVDPWARLDVPEVQSFINTAADAPASSGSSLVPDDESSDDDQKSSSCGSITFDGACEGDTLHFCDEGVLETIVCSDFGGTCAPVEPSGFDCHYDD